MVLGLKKLGVPEGRGVFGALCFTLLFFGCTQVEFDNPYDPDGINYYNSSSSEGESSSSVEPGYSSSGGGNSSPSGGGVSSSSKGSNSCPTASGNVFIDPRDCKAYKFETASNGAVWMSENLNYSRDNTLGYCYGVNINGANPHQDASGCDNGYGRVYEWSVAMDDNSPQGLCPDGWHIPNVDEWSSITDNLEYCGSINMSNNFCISGGNYNMNSNYPPLGWKEKDYSGFYWTSSGYAYFAGLWHCSPTNNPTSDGCMDIQNSGTIDGYFSVRCIAYHGSIVMVRSSSSVTGSSSSVSSVPLPSSSSQAPSSSSVYNILYGTPVTYGNETYQTVVIGTQTWFAENLNYDEDGSKCYNDDPVNCDKYGRLYNWSTAMSVCPSGWHLPTIAEWDALSSYVQSNSGCSSCDTRLLKATSGWNIIIGNGTDKYGFSALPGGSGYSDGSFTYVGDYGHWWSASEHNSNSHYAYYRLIGRGDEYTYLDNYYKSHLVSVRCLQD